MTRYDEYPEHPLYGVPQDVLDAARSVLDGAAEWKDVMQSMVEPLADAVVMRLHEAGFITWPGKGVAHIHDVVRTPEEWEQHQFDTEPVISKYPLVRWPGDPGFDKDGGVLDFGVENVDHVVLPRPTEVPVFWQQCDDTDPHKPHRIEPGEWCPGVPPLG